jgi:hypothetical protein
MNSVALGYAVLFTFAFGFFGGFLGLIVGVLQGLSLLCLRNGFFLGRHHFKMDINPKPSGFVSSFVPTCYYFFRRQKRAEKYMMPLFFGNLVASLMSLLVSTFTWSIGEHWTPDVFFTHLLIGGCCGGLGIVVLILVMYDDKRRNKATKLG